MAVRKLLIANRGEIAVRIARAAAELGIATLAVFSEDDAASLHRRLADEAAMLPGRGPAAYLDAEAIVAAALAGGCDALHPGYGFLSESADFARLCGARGLVFVGPGPGTLEAFGDKTRARALAVSLGVPSPEATAGAASLAEVRAFQANLRPGEGLMIKAAAGGGGRGMRPVAAGEDPARAFELCAREAEAAFGDGRLYAERIIPAARHIEVQLIGDGARVLALHDRECSIQRRRQKLIEVAPAPGLDPALRARLREAALKLGEAAGLASLATVEFLLGGDGSLAFIEVNPRLQVEHTVTEAVTGLDLVQLQLRIAGGASLADLGLTEAPPARGHAIELRVNLETLAADGSVTGAGGTLTRYEPPSGPGVRVDGFGYAGYASNPAFDPLIAKLVVATAAGDFAACVGKARRAAAEFHLEGAPSNLALLRAVLERPEVAAGQATTGFFDLALPKLLARAAELAPVPSATAAPAARGAPPPTPPGTVAVTAPLRGTLVSLEAGPGDGVRAGQPVAVVEAMKMQHVVPAPAAGVVVALSAALDAVVDADWPIMFIEPGDAQHHAVDEDASDLDHIRGDLAEVRALHALTLDANRPDAVARRRRTDQRTARENLGAVFDAGSFKEYGALAVAAQRSRRSLDDLRKNTPADGIVTGVGEVNGADFGPEDARCVGLAYDFTVLAGTQGRFSHKKTDRMLELAEHWRAPVIWFTEGGGGRPGDVDANLMWASRLDTTSFTTFARTSGVAPRIAVNSGRCFAGNAVFFGCADVTIATRNSNIGLGGPAMIEGGGLGVFGPDDIGPSHELYANGVIDILVEDEAAGAAAARQVLSYFQGTRPDWRCADQRNLRHLVPENRLRVYDIRRVIETLADEGSFLELRGGYGAGLITGFLRLEGRPLGLIANDPVRLGGAIDSEGAEKGARFLQLCDAFDVPVLSLCDTPGFMVGPDSERTAAVRRGSRLFVTAATLSVPFFTVVLRKGYGLGAQAMAGGDFTATAFTIAWPSAEFGPMGLEGAVRLGFKKELDAEADPAARQALFENLLAGMYETGKAVSVARALEIDAVIDPSETRAWILQGLKAAGSAPRRTGKKRPFVDVW